MQIDFENLDFKESTHTYYYNNEKIPSVSELTRFISKDIYGNVDEYMLGLAAERGTKIHQYCEDVDKNGYADVEERYKGYIEAYIAYKRKYNINYTHIESYVLGELYNNRYAGRIDRLGTNGNNKTVLIDIKNTSSIGRKVKRLYEASLNLYRLALKKMEIEVDEMYILQLKKDGKHRMIPITISDELPNACMTLHMATM